MITSTLEKKGHSQYDIIHTPETLKWVITSSNTGGNNVTNFEYMNKGQHINRVGSLA